MGSPVRRTGGTKMVVIESQLTDEQKKRIVAMLDKHCPAEMAQMRADAARINCEYVRARAEYAVAQVRADRALRARPC
jgi:hypothetical protein